MRLTDTNKLLNKISQEVFEYSTDKTMFYDGNYWIRYDRVEEIVEETSSEPITVKIADPAPTLEIKINPTERSEEEWVLLTKSLRS